MKFKICKECYKRKTEGYITPNGFICLDCLGGFIHDFFDFWESE